MTLLKSTRTRGLVLVLALMPFLATCDDSSGVDPVIVELALSGWPDEVVLGAVTPLVVRGRDEVGEAVRDIPLEWSSGDRTVLRIDRTSGDTAWVEAVGMGSAAVTVSVAESDVFRGGSASASVGVVVSGVELAAGTPRGDTLTALGDSVELGARGLDDGGEGVAGTGLTWSVSPEDVVVLHGGGAGDEVVVEAVGEGTATVEVMSSACVGECVRAIEIEVEQVPAALAAERGTMAFHSLGQSAPLAATVFDARGNVMAGADVAWSLDSAGAEEVVELADGSVTALGNGEAVLLAVAGEVADTVPVAVHQEVTAVELSDTVVSLSSIGDVATVSAVARDSGGSALSRPHEMEWAVGDSALVRLELETENARRLTALGNGETYVVGRVEGISSDSTPVVVAQVPATAELTPSAAELEPGDTLRLGMVVADSSGERIAGAAISWSVSDTAVATITDGGLLTAMSAGTVWAVGSSGLAVDSARVVVLAAEVGSIDLAVDTLRFGALGDTLRPGVTVLTVDGDALSASTVAWSVVGDPVASVTSDGVVESLTNGVAALVAAVGEHADTAVIEVAQVAAAVDIAPADTVRALRDTVQLTVALRDANGHPMDAPVEWAAMDEDRLQPIGSGAFDALLPGTARVTASAGTAVDTTEVVVRPVVTSGGLSVDSLDLVIGDTARLTATFEDANGFEVAGAGVSWSSSDTTVAEVDSTGLVTAVAAGDGQITAASGGVFTSARVTVAEPVLLSAEIESIEVDRRYATQGEAVTVTLSAQNTGAIAPASARLILSFPLLTQPSDSAELSGAPGSSSGEVTLRPATSSLRTAGDSVKADHLVAEWRAASPWGPGETRTFAVRWVPEATGSTEVRGRVVFEDPSSPPAMAPDSGVAATVMDQQGYAVLTAPIQIQAAGGPIAASSLLSAGLSNSTCGLTRSGEAYCWGFNAHGQLGNGESWQENSPVLSFSGRRWSSLATGGSSACGIAPAGDAWCWGRGTYGVLGNGDELDSAEPVLVSGGHQWASLTVGGPACGLTTGGEAYCWGYNGYGQLGTGDTDARSSPAPVAGGHSWAQLTAGGRYACGVTTAGTAYCWGQNRYGELGTDTTLDATTPQLVAGGHSWASVTTGGNHACGITTSGAAYCWGRGGYLGDEGFSSQSAPVPVSGGHLWSSLDAGGQHTCGITLGGDAYCWGDDGAGQLGNGFTSYDQRAPSAVYGDHSWKSIAAGWSHTCGITTTDEVYCWGNGNDGAIGTGDVGDRTAPTAVVGYTPDGGMGTPTGVALTESGYDDVTVRWSWSGVGGQAATFRLERSTRFYWEEGGGWAWTQWEVVDSTITEATRYEDRRLDDGTHRYRVMGCEPDAGLCSAYAQSDTVVIDTEPPTPTVLSFAASPPASAQLGDTVELSMIAGNDGDGPARRGSMTLEFPGLRNPADTAAVMVAGHSPGIVTWHPAGASVQMATGTKTAEHLIVRWTDTTTWYPTEQRSLSLRWAPADTGSHTVQGRVMVEGSDSVRSFAPAAGQGDLTAADGRDLEAATFQVEAGDGDGGGIQILADSLDISASWTHTCGITESGEAYCWGRGTGGQLGYGGTASHSNAATRVAGTQTWSAISVGADFTCGLAEGGAAYCWGVGQYGRLGNGGTTTQPSPVLVAGGHTWASLTTGNDYACGLTAAGDAYCWGNNSKGQLGDGTFTQRPSPTLVAGGHEWAQLNAGMLNTCGITTSGDAYCWGYGSSGQLGTGATTDQRTPALVAGDRKWVAISTGTTTCGITTEHEAFCWGRGASGQLGNGDEADRSEPSLVYGGLAWQSISAYSSHSCGITTGGAAHCWGDGGRLGTGESISRSTPVAVEGGQTWTAVTVGSRHTCGLTADGGAYCWGRSSSGELGIDTTGIRLTPTAVVGYDRSGGFGAPMELGVTVVNASDVHLTWTDASDKETSYRIERRRDFADSLWAVIDSVPAGTESYQDLRIPAGRHEYRVRACSSALSACSGSSYPATAYTQLPRPELLSLTSTRSSIALGDTVAISLAADNLGGWAADAAMAYFSFPALTAIGDTALVALAAGSGGSLRLYPAGSRMASGDGSADSVTVSHLVAEWTSAAGWAGGVQDTITVRWVPRETGEAVVHGRIALGASGRFTYAPDADTGDVTDATGGAAARVALDVVTALAPMASSSPISLGQNHGCGVATNGDAYCWGYNAFGQLGNGIEGVIDPAVMVTGGHDWSTVDAGRYHSCGLTTSGVAYCWGWGRIGELGTGDTLPRLEPSPVAGGHAWTDMAAGADHACGVTTTGDMYCWGYNFYGEVGDGSTTQRNSPTLVSGGHTWVGVDAGGRTTCGLTTAGDIYCWGNNQSGQLATGSTSGTSNATPVKVPGGPWATVAVGSFRVCGMSAAGEALCWGAGQTTPAPVTGENRWAAVGGACGLNMDGDVRCWDYPTEDADGIRRYHPDPALAGPADWTAFMAADGSGCGFGRDGGAYCWGTNSGGRLGDGTTEEREAPVAVLGFGRDGGVGAPGGLVATVAGDTASIAWRDGSTNESRFAVERRTGDAAWVEVHSAMAGDTSWTDAGLPGGGHAYRVRACSDAAGLCSGYSNVDSVWVGGLTAPTAVATAADGDSAIDLSWTNDNTDEFYVRVWRTRGDHMVELDSIPAGSTAYRDTTVVAGWVYRYAVEACQFECQRSVVVSDSTAPLALTAREPMSVSGAAGSRRYVALEVPAATESSTIALADIFSDNPDLYVRRGALPTPATNDCASTGPDANESCTLAVAGDTTPVYALIVGTTDYFSVDLSATLTGVAAPAAASGVTYAASADAARLEWTNNASGADFIRVWRGRSDSLAVVDTLAAGTRSFLDEGLEPGFLYRYRIETCAALCAMTDTVEVQLDPIELVVGDTLRGLAGPEGTDLTLAFTVPGTADSIRVSLEEEPSGWSNGNANMAVWRAGDSTFACVASAADSNESCVVTQEPGSEDVQWYVWLYGNTSYSDLRLMVDHGWHAELPRAPSPVTASATSDTSLTVAWVPEGGTADVFRIYRGQGASAALVDSVAGGVTSFADEGLEAGFTYHYLVEACGGGVCATSDAATGSLPPMAVSAPVTLAGLEGDSLSRRYLAVSVPGDADSVTFDMAGAWGDADLYVRRGDLPTYQTYDCASTQTGSNESCVLPQEAAGGDVVWYVLISGTDLYADVTFEASYPGEVGPAAPTELAASVAPDSLVHLTWTPPSTGDYLRVYRGTSEFAAEIDSLPATASSYVDSTFERGFQQRYLVASCDATGCATSESATVDTHSPIALGDTVTGLGGGATSMRFFALHVPAGTDSVAVELTGGTGDADLYVGFGRYPTATAYDCRSYAWGNEERCSVVGTVAEDEIWYVGVRGYSVYDGVTVRAGGTAASAPTLTAEATGASRTPSADSRLIESEAGEAKEPVSAAPTTVREQP